jgi:class 3 adenylate cyclase
MVGEGQERCACHDAELGLVSCAWQHHFVRVHRSFAFVDVSGFTALTETEGDERAVDVLTAFRTLLRDICSRRGVRIAKWLGDGVMLVCVDTRPLLETVLELHYVVAEVADPDETVSIRSGITSGDVILMEGDDYVGHCVNVAARLCDLAAPGEALAAPSVLDHLPAWGLVMAQTPVRLRGVENPVPAASIDMARRADEGALDPICGLPLSHDTAVEIAHDVRGSVVLFCSPGCVDTWRRRPPVVSKSAV